jgi:hypothetical protein
VNYASSKAGADTVVAAITACTVFWGFGTGLSPVSWRSDFSTDGSQFEQNGKGVDPKSGKTVASKDFFEWILKARNW